MRGTSGLVAVLLAASLSGCSEEAVIRSGPSGADVYVNGQLAGKTPLRYVVPRDQVGDPFQVRIEKKGYEPVTTSFQARLAGGRVTGAVFTLGVLAIFRSMYAIDPIFVPLDSLQGDQDRQLGESLRNLRTLYDTGQISDQEYRRRQDELLQAK